MDVWPNEFGAGLWLKVEKARRSQSLSFGVLLAAWPWQEVRRQEEEQQQQQKEQQQLRQAKAAGALKKKLSCKRLRIHKFIGVKIRTRSTVVLKKDIDWEQVSNLADFFHHGPEKPGP